MGELPGRMPDLVRATRSFRHTVDSALRSLRRRGLAQRVVLESAGPGWPHGTVVQQHPAPGAPLEPGGFITLRVAGPGGLLSLPYPMRTVTRGVVAPAGDDGEPARPRPGAVGADRLFALFDHQVLTLLHHVRGAGGYLALREDAPETARRWIEEVFDLRPGEWPRERWHRLARLLPRLHRLAGRPEGVRAAFREVLGLAVVRVEARVREVPLAEGAWTRLGERASRLGFDAVVGRGVAAEAETAVVIHVPTPRKLRRQAAEPLRRQRLLLYGLLLPVHLDPARVVERWLVGPPLGRGRLRDPHHPASLGAPPELFPAFPAGAFP